MALIPAFMRNLTSMKITCSPLVVIRSISPTALRHRQAITRCPDNNNLNATTSSAIRPIHSAFCQDTGNMQGPLRDPVTDIGHIRACQPKCLSRTAYAPVMMMASRLTFPFGYSHMISVVWVKILYQEQACRSACAAGRLFRSPHSLHRVKSPAPFRGAP